MVTAGLGVTAALNGLALDTSQEAIEEAAHKVGMLPRHRLGNGKRQISALVGASDWAPEAVEAGILCGINYWHKAQSWRMPTSAADAGKPGFTPAAILKNREAYYCEVIVDRVRGSHETGEIDEEAFYQFVKQALDKCGLRYFDDYKFHFGYHSVAEWKNNRGPLKVYERLKKEGVVKHLALSQHSYNGNAMVPGGDSAEDMLNAIINEGLYEHAQFIYSFGSGDPVEQVLDLARRKGFGTIVMKTSQGAGRMREDAEFMKNFPADASPHNIVARWITTTAKVDAAVVTVQDLNQFVDTCSGAGKPLRAADVRGLEQMVAYANQEVCRLCNQCMSHCPQQLQIADILRYERYALDYHDHKAARRLYGQLDKQADSCTECGACLPHCPQSLRITEKLARAHRILG
jgi:predicted aldo/keto reductase-like oxidoreductase